LYVGAVDGVIELRSGAVTDSAQAVREETVRASARRARVRRDMEPPKDLRLSENGRRL
jgi:hypothetical protein